MREYLNKPMGALAADLAAGLVRLRKGYVDAVEALIEMVIVEPDRKYPYELAVYRITGFRGSRSEPPSEPISGQSLACDLQTLILDLCDSFTLRCADYGEPAYDSDAIARRFNVSTKTIRRWRRDGMVARRLVFPDGKRRVAYLDSSVRRFTDHRGRRVARSRKFTQLSRAEREAIISQARSLASETKAGASEIARRVAASSGRAVETIRYTIRKHDREHPAVAIFGSTEEPLSPLERTTIYRSFLHGVTVPKLARSYGRTRGSIYRVVNETRAASLLNRPISYIPSEEFELSNADSLILSAPDRQVDSPAPAKAKRISTGELPPYLKSLYEVPLLDAEAERDLFRRYNYLKYKADVLRNRIDTKRVRTGLLREVEQLLVQANVVKNRITRANLRLVVSIAKKHVSGAQTLFELVSDGNISLMRAVEKFDYSRGYRFSTYSSWAIMRNFARSVPKERYRRDRFATGYDDDLLFTAASLQSYDPDEVNVVELRESIDALLAQLRPRERVILIGHYGLDQDGKTKTLGQLGEELGLSKERIRQIEIQAIMKLRKITHREEEGFLV